MKKFLTNLLVIIIIFASFSVNVFASQKTTLLNVSYDPTRELYDEYNSYFKKYWLSKTGQKIEIQQSHGGSGKQARSVIDGLGADVVTLALAYDIDVISDKAKLLDVNWQKQFSHNSSPYTSTIVFLVRKGNPKHIKDWNDLTRNGIQVITPNPKTSGGARWNYLAAYGYADKKFASDEKKIRGFLTKLFANVPIYDTAARGAGITFAQRGIGDVLISWENEAFLTQKELGNQFEIIVPSISILAEPPVAVVDKITKKHDNYKLAKAYLAQLYSKQAQEIIAKNFYRPIDLEISKKYEKQFPKVNLVTIQDFGGWRAAQKKHFDDGGLFDQITNIKKN